jgi:hypothetical protein
VTDIDILQKKLDESELRYKTLKAMTLELAESLSESNKFLEFIGFDWTNIKKYKINGKAMQCAMEHVYLAQQKAFGHFINDLYDLEENQ